MLKNAFCCEPRVSRSSICRASGMNTEIDAAPLSPNLRTAAADTGKVLKSEKLKSCPVPSASFRLPLTRPYKTGERQLRLTHERQAARVVVGTGAIVG